MARTLKLKLFGVTVLEWTDDEAQSLYEALGDLLEAQGADDEIEDGTIVLGGRQDYTDTDPDLGHLVYDSEPEFTVDDVPYDIQDLDEE